MKTKVLKYFVLGCALAFMNCGDDSKDTLTSTLGDDGQPVPEQQALIPLLDENGNPVLDENGNQVMIPNPNAAVEGYIPLLDENGNPVLDENGNQVMVQDSTLRDNPESSLNINIGGDDEQTDNPSAEGGENVPQTDSTKTQTDDPATQGDENVSQKDTTKTDDGESAKTSDPADDTPATPAVESSSSEEAKIESSSSEAPAAKKIFLAEGKEEEKDYLKVEYKQGTGPDGKSILSYPSQLSNDQKHAIVVWGPGGGTEPAAYEGMIRRLASHGFVVIALRESPGDGHLATEALDWLEKENQNPSSPLNGKLDMNTVGCSGHSMGGLESEQAVIKDKRVLTAFMNNSGDWNGDGANHVPTDRSIAILYGEAGSERGNAENDYNNQGVKAPACLIGMFDGPKGGEGGYGHGSGSWDGMAATVAWMRWHLGGEDFRKADFVGTSGKYINGAIAGHQGKWKGECKNF